MPNLSEFSNDSKVSMMLMGHSGAGKTGSLVSLVQAGYKLRIIDLDMGLDILLAQLREKAPRQLANVSYMSFRDRIKMSSQGPTVVGGTPKALTGAAGALDKWEDGTTPEEWDKDTILVLDSLTALGTAAFHLARHMNPTAKEPRTWYNVAQNMVEAMLANLTDKAFSPHVIVITHIDTRKDEFSGDVQGFPSSIGAAVGPKIPRYFNTLILCEVTGTGDKAKRQLRTAPTSLTPSVKVPLKADLTLPIESGLATLFETLRGTRPAVN